MDTGIQRILYDHLLRTGMSENMAAYLNLLILLIGSLILAGLLDFVVWKVLRAISVRLARKSATNFDNYLVMHRVPRYVARIVPLLLLFELAPIIFMDFEKGGSIAFKVIQILFLIATLSIVKSLFRSIKDYLKTKRRYRDKPLDSYIQVFMIVAWIFGALTIFAIVTETSIWKFFTALGAASAIILLIFKDSILGLVASIQVSINDMVRIGDWITFDKYGADGDVIEITLATVKVQNFDKTITTIPTYALISNSFKNWRGMQESGGRRIKRPLIISQKGIRFLSDQDVEDLKRIELVRPYLMDRNEKIKAHNESHGVDKSLAVNGRNLTNIGVFRKYVQEYLGNHPAVHKGMTLMVRQLQPEPHGIPLEIYAFSSDKRWENYEYIMADIFDHLLSALPFFGLEVFEWPTSLSPIKPRDGWSLGNP